ncbi:MAG: phytoene/squalene synthase family protein [Haloferacaceae archaeon]
MSRHAADPLPGGNADLDWCHDAVQGVSRTFALTVDVLEEPMSSYICIGYLVCRIADTIEDAGHIPPEEQTRLLRLYDAALDPEDDTDVEEFTAEAGEWLPEDRDDDWEVVANAPRVFRTFDALDDDVREAVTPPARELVQGMIRFVERYDDEGGLRIESREELEEYCYYAAGTVGNLITNLVTRGDIETSRAKRLYDTAEEFGLLLQLVNISKDVYEDYTEENNVYLPAEWLRAEGVPQDELVDPEHESGATAVVRRTADRARDFLDDAQTYLETVPLVDGNTLEAWAIPYLLAVGTLRELRANPQDALRDTSVKVSRQEVFAVVAAMSGTDECESLGEFRETITRKPFHRAALGAD